jgi:hypothetical protein
MNRAKASSPKGEDFPRRLSHGLSALSSEGLETLLLRALCQAQPSAVRNDLLFSLQDYEWRDPEHGLLLEAVAELSRCSSDELQRALPAHLTRAGFPDTDVSPFFAPLEWSGDSLLSLASELCGMLMPSTIPRRKPKSRPAPKSAAGR